MLETVPGIFRIFIINTSYCILCSILFIKDLRFPGRMIFIGTLLLNTVLSAFLHSYGYTVFSIFICYTGYILFYNFTVRFPFYKTLYILLGIQAYYSMLNIILHYIAARRGSTQILAGCLTLLTYLLILLLCKKLFYPVYQCSPAKIFKRLCISPLLFLFINTAHPFTLVSSPYSSLMIILVGLFIYYFTLLFLYKSTIIIEKQTAMESQLHLLEEHSRQLIEQIEQAKSLRHDLRHHAAVIYSYASLKNTDAVLTYLHQYLKGIPSSNAALPYCKNLAVNAVVHHYTDIAKTAGAKVDCRLCVDQAAGIPDIDLCIIFGNLMENAACSCLESNLPAPFIYARCNVTNHQLILIIDNSCSQINDKKNSCAHIRFGTGLYSVHAVTKKWNGQMKVSLDQNIFHTSILLNLPVS